MKTPIFAADKRMDVIAGQVAIAGEELEYLDVAIGGVNTQESSAIGPRWRQKLILRIGSIDNDIARLYTGTC